MTAAWDSMDGTILGYLQQEVPVEIRPYDVLGERCGLSGEEVLTRVQRLKADKIIRQISAIFDTRSLGYASSLVAARVAPEDLPQAVRVINQHPGVSHNYLRGHEFNLWFTIAVPPDSTLGLAGTVARLHTLSGARAMRVLPTEKLYKIGVRFDMGGESPVQAAGPAFFSESDREATRPLNALEMRFVALMQEDLPLVPEPFLPIAKELGLDFDSFQKLHQDFLESGRMRRFAAVLHHRKAGFRANAMGVWNPGTLDDTQIDTYGAIMAGFREVSHCYRRPVYPDWPFSLFTMVHGKSVADCEATLQAIAEKTGIPNYHALYSTEEFKKVRVRYFTGAEIAWERDTENDAIAPVTS